MTTVAVLLTRAAGAGEPGTNFGREAPFGKAHSGIRFNA